MIFSRRGFGQVQTSCIYFVPNYKSRTNRPIIACNKQLNFDIKTAAMARFIIFACTTNYDQLHSIGPRFKALISEY